MEPLPLQGTYTIDKYTLLTAGKLLVQGNRAALAAPLISFTFKTGLLLGEDARQFYPV